MSTPALSPSESIESLRAWIVQWLGDHLQRAPSGIGWQVRLRDLGLDSAKATRLVVALSERLGRQLPLTLIWEHPTVEALAHHLTAPVTVEAAGSSRAAEPLEARRLPAETAIAVVALACRFPGGAHTPSTYWKLLEDGLDMVRPIPADRYDAEAYYDRDLRARGKAVTRWGGFLESTDTFDPYLFGISPREAAEMDPQQRLLLELAWESFESAGLSKEQLRDRRVGVFVGSMWNDYARLRHGTRTIEQFTATGQDDSIISARISYVFGLRGPSMTINTACSSSLVAVHLACQSLLNGESELALAGAVNLIFGPDSTVAMSKFGGMAPDGRCKAFDARANGYVRGEGAGVVLLKPLRQALEAGEPIHAIIRGSAINNDGFSNGLTSPSPAAQAEMLRAAYANAGVSPGAVHYVEAHGTGTMLGDPIEAGALGEVLGQHPERRHPLRIGSVKTNIGHLEAAAGMAGLLKTIEALKRRRLPASLHFEQPNPNIRFEALRLEVQAQPSPWPGEPGGGDELFAGVSSFGFGGTNAHVVLQSFLPARPLLVPIGAADVSSLPRRADELRTLVERCPESSLDELVTTWLAQNAEQPATARRALLVSSRAELLAQLSGAPPLDATSAVAPVAPAAGLVFVFTGNGSQWAGMACDLMEHGGFSRAITECDAALREEGCDGVGVALRRGELDLARVDLIQPALWALQVSLVSLWRSWGVTPAAVVGHSVGEIAAAWAAGSLTLREAARVVVHRSRLQEERAGQGGMVLLEAAAERVQELLDEVGDSELAIAAVNTHASTVVSGAAPSLQTLISRAAERRIATRAVRVNVAYHGPQMRDLRGRLVEALPDLAASPPRIPMISTVTGAPIAQPMNAEYWGRNLADPVRFADAIDALFDAGHRAFFELGPHPTLASATAAQLRHRGADECFVGVSLEREQPSRLRLLKTLGQWFELGGGVDWTALGGGEARLAPRPVPLLLPFSAHTELALRQRIAATGRYLREHPETDLAALAHTLATGRTHLERRAAIVVTSGAELVELGAALDADEAGEATLPPEVIRPPKALAAPVQITFVFPGQGSQWLGMGRQLLQTEPVFRRVIEQWEPLFLELSGWSLLEQLAATPEASRLGEVDVVQPTLFAIQTALAALWRSWGIHPAAVIGHSMGEVAAAYVAGALGARDAARIICSRSRIAKQTSGRGGMAVIELTPEECLRAIAAHTATVSLAACNGPTSCVISGDSAALEQIGREQAARDVFFRPVKVDYASHSPQMDEIKDELLRELAETTPSAPRILFYSTVENAPIETAALDATYWSRNLREPVMFFQGAKALEARGCNVFLEISPHPVLTYSIAKAVDPERIAILGSGKREEDERCALLGSLGTIFAAGGTVDWWAVLASLDCRAAQVLPALPAYPFQRERCWFAEPDGRGAWQDDTALGRHAFLDRFLRSPFPRERLVWECDVSLERFPYLEDHRVGGIAVFPGTGYIECVLEAARELYGEAPVELAGVAFEKALLLEAGATRALQLGMEPDGEGHRFSLSSHDAALNRWVRHVTGSLRPLQDAGTASSQRAVDEAVLADGAVDAFYGNLERAGNTYGPRFQAVRQLRTSAREVRGRIAMAEEQATRGMRIHPIVLDACLQVMAWPIAMDQVSSGRESAFMPTRAERICVYREAGHAVESHVFFHEGSAANKAAGDLYADIEVYNAAGQRVALIERICFHLLEQATAAVRPASELIHRVAWEEVSPLPEVVTSGAGTRRWLLFADDGGVAEAVHALLGSQPVHRVLPSEAFRRDGDDFHLRPGAAEDYRALLEQLPAEPLHVLHLWNLRLAEPSETLPAEMAALSCLSLVELLQAADELGGKTTPRAWIATAGVWTDGETATLAATAPSPAQAPVWGLTRAIAQEHPSAWGGIVDLDPEERPQLQAQRLLAEILAPAGEEDRLRYHRGRRLASRLTAGLDSEAALAGAVPSFRADRAYLITGGLGALGLRLASWMIGRGARHLVLLSRSPLPPRRTWTRADHDAATLAKIKAVRALECLGAHVRTPAFDVGDAAALTSFLEDYRREARPPLAGVAHLAGVIRSELLAMTRPAALDEVFRSKVQGAWNLHCALASEPLDFFVMFSSASAVLNSPLLGGYAAANAFLDGLAHFRRALGLPAQALDWGFWGEAGMAARELQLESADKPAQGMRSFAPATGLEVLGELMVRNPVQAVILDVDWPVWLAAYPAAATSPLLRGLRAAHGVAKSEASASTSAGEQLRELRSLPAEEQRSSVENLLLEELAAVLKTRAAKISRTALFGSMGLDSMLSLELRNRLERRTGMTLPGTLVWNYPSAEKMAGFLLEKLGAREEEVVDVVPPVGCSLSLRGDALAPPSDEVLDVLREMGVIEDGDPVLSDPQALWNLVREAEKFLES